MSTLTPDQLQSVAYQEAHPNDNLQYQIIVSDVVLGIIAVLAVIARVVSRRLAGVKFALDDYLALFALTTFLTYIAITVVAMSYGLGKHIIYVTDPYGLGWSFIVAECMYNVTIPCLKLSLLWLYGRIFPQRWFKICLIANAVFVLAYSTAFFFADLFKCYPISKSWDPTIPGRCVNYPDVIITGCVVNAISDIMLLLLPVPLIWKLKLKQTKRMKLIVMFTVGTLCCLSSLVRIGFAYDISAFDGTWDITPLIVTTTVELGISCLATCTPTYTTIINYFTGSLASTKASRSYYSNGAFQGPVLNINSSSSSSSSKKHIWETTTEPRSGDDIELARQGGEVSTNITIGV